MGVNSWSAWGGRVWKGEVAQGTKAWKGLFLPELLPSCFLLPIHEAISRSLSHPLYHLGGNQTWTATWIKINFFSFKLSGILFQQGGMWLIQIWFWYKEWVICCDATQLRGSKDFWSGSLEKFGNVCGCQLEKQPYHACTFCSCPECTPGDWNEGWSNLVEEMSWQSNIQVVTLVLLAALSQFFIWHIQIILKVLSLVRREPQVKIGPLMLELRRAWLWKR